MEGNEFVLREDVDRAERCFRSLPGFSNQGAGIWGGDGVMRWLTFGPCEGMGL